MTVALTGATGTIGMYVLQVLRDAGHDVLPFCRPHSPRRARLSAYDEILFCDSDGYTAFNPPQKADVFLHLAWEGATVEHRDDVALQTRNLQTTLDAVELAARMGCSAFVFATSQAEIGRSDAPIGETTPPFPESAYGIAKLAAGGLGRLLCRQLGMRHSTARILSVFSPMAGDNQLVNYLVRTLLAGENPSLTPCEQLWDLLDPHSAARMLCAIAEKGKDGAVYTLGSGNPQPLREYIEQIRDRIDPALPLGFGEKPYYPHQPMVLCADTSNLQADTGVELPANADFLREIDEMIEHYKTKSKDEQP